MAASATSDLNDLYRRVINRNNRLKRPDRTSARPRSSSTTRSGCCRRPRRRAVRQRPPRPSGQRPGQPPAQVAVRPAEGQAGPFRQNLLGVDYSGRSVIVVGPQLQLYQCGLPKQMALELPAVRDEALRSISTTRRTSSRPWMVERGCSQAWDVLEEVIPEHPGAALNRASILHRPASRPRAAAGGVARPSSCTRWPARFANADFDGDQMAVHLPLSAEAQSEARVLMLSSNKSRLRRPAAPLAMPRLGHGDGSVPPDPPARRRSGRRQPLRLLGRGDHTTTAGQCCTRRRRSRSTPQVTLPQGTDGP
ncbi:hypothetical protein HBB16_06850 [Pseudonocardia sp. MCCB 268]|nr:hypothetical protein [Pseudonocardia cytotoxica]